jgi:hypothetical protein
VGFLPNIPKNGILQSDESGVYPNEIDGQRPGILAVELLVKKQCEVFFTMRLGHHVLVFSIALSLALPAAAVTHSRRHPTSSHAIAKSSSKGTLKPASLRTSAKKGKHAVKPKKTRIIGQRAIDDERATQIQSALIKAGYLSGEPSGHWDSESEAAMQKVQSDNGWQTKLVPDSRALIKLGLGPSINPGESLASPPAIGGSSAAAVADQ